MKTVSADTVYSAAKLLALENGKNARYAAVPNGTAYSKDVMSNEPKQLDLPLFDISAEGHEVFRLEEDLPLCFFCQERPRMSPKRAYCSACWAAMERQR